MEERVTKIYNACWKNYKEYLADHDMEHIINDRRVMPTVWCKIRYKEFIILVFSDRE